MKQTPVEFLENYLKIKGLIIHSPDNIIMKEAKDIENDQQKENDYTALLKPVGTKQTAVESIIEFCEKQKNNDVSSHRGAYLTIINFCKEQAKEMEKQQQGYSEEEVYHILCEHTAFLFAGGKSTLTEWFEQFKNK